MSATFAEAAARCGALAAQVLGWRPAEFWSATPAELAMARDMIAHMMERDAHD